MSKDSPSTSKMSLILDIKSKKIEEVIYFISYIVVEAPANSPFAINEIVNLSNSKNSHSVRIKLRKLLQEIKKTTAKSSPEDSEIASRYFDDLYDDNSLLTLDHLFDFVHKYTKIKFMIGAEALQYLLEKVNLKDEQRKVKQLIAKRETKDPLDMLFLLKRLDLINSFIKSGINPANMIMNVLPVTPPGTRPIVTLDNGKTTTNDINHLYARVIIRNNRLRNIIDLGAPIVIINNEKRLLQEAIDALLDNSKTKNVTLAQKEKRPLKSFTEHLTGKTGLFRQNLLGKRVDYSARSVIAVGPNLKLYEVGLPVDIVLKMFKPFIIRDLTKRVTINGLEQDAIVDSVKLAEQMIDDKDPAI
jgi:DNA-directed RNA polymerase subunit beta'